MKKIYIILAAIIDAVLLTVILKSYASRNKTPQPDAASSSRASVTQTLTTATQRTETAQQTTQQASESAADSAAATGNGGSKISYSTDAFAQYQDMAGTFLNGSSGFVWQELSDKAEKLTDFSDVSGGWKAYIVSSPDDIAHSVTYLMNIRLSGSEKNVTVTLDWDYFYVNDSGDEGHSTEPDSVYTGSWDSAGKAEAEGMGMITLHDFYFDNGKQYGLGTVSWPDNTYGAIALVRP